MKFTSFLQSKLTALLNDRRIVVWYDSGGDFKTMVAAFNAPNCEVLSAEESVLKIRRRADRIYRLMNESENPKERDRCMLIYINGCRGVTEEEKIRDPFEVYATAGAAFGDTEDQRLESLAKQAMPHRADEISRLFREGRPDVALLERLEDTQRWPVLNKVFHTETPAEVIALALCDRSKSKTVDQKPGCIEELLRLFESAVGFKPEKMSRQWDTLLAKAAEYILFSEFLLDHPDEQPDALSAVPRAGIEAKGVVYAACERMRADSGLREAYMDIAQKVENGLRLPEIMPKGSRAGNRDTFPFEDLRQLGCAVNAVVAGDFATVRMVTENRQNSIWRRDPQRAPGWTVLERGVALVETAAKVLLEIISKKSLAGLVKAYIENKWSDLDRCFRLFETALTACTDEETLSPVIELSRNRYRETATKAQNVFLEAVQAEGWPPDEVPKQVRIFDEHLAPLLERREKTVFFMVDSLRYEMGRDLGESLTGIGESKTSYAAAVVPTVTDFGMAALMPGADGMLRLVEKDGELVPVLGKRLLKTSADRMKLLADSFGDRFFETTLDELFGSPRRTAAAIKDVEFFVVRTHEPDSIAESLGSWRARRYLSDVVGDIANAVRWVVTQGFKRVVISSDHGHMMLPEILAGDIVKGPSGKWLENKRRCLLGSGLAGADGTITLKAGHVGIQGDLKEVCFPIGFRVFSDGTGYFHGGLSLQEALVPVVVFRAERETPSTAGKPGIEIKYRSDKFTSRVVGLTVLYQVKQMGAFGNPPVSVRIEAYDGTGPKAKVVGESADCEARNENTREVMLQPNKETPVPLLIDPDFDGLEVEIRVSDPHTRVVWARRKLKNAMLD